MEIRLFDSSKLSVTRLADRRVEIQLHQPRNLRDGHGFTLVGQAVLEGEALVALLAELTQGHEREAA